MGPEYVHATGRDPPATTKDVAFGAVSVRSAGKEEWISNAQ